MPKCEILLSRYGLDGRLIWRRDEVDNEFFSEDVGKAKQRVDARRVIPALEPRDGRFAGPNLSR